MLAATVALTLVILIALTALAVLAIRDSAKGSHEATERTLALVEPALTEPPDAGAAPVAASDSDGWDEALAEETLGRLKQGDPTVSFSSLAEVDRLDELAFYLKDTEATAILKDMRRFGFASFAKLLGRSGPNAGISRATQRAISACLVGGEVRNLADFRSKILDQSQQLPVMTFIHDGWASREVGLWCILRDAAQAADKPLAPLIHRRAGGRDLST